MMVETAIIYSESNVRSCDTCDNVTMSKPYLAIQGVQASLFSEDTCTSLPCFPNKIINILIYCFVFGMFFFHLHLTFIVKFESKTVSL